MHNIKEIRNDVEAFKKALNKRFIEIDVDKILSLDENNREYIQQRELLEKEKKDISKSKDESLFKKSIELCHTTSGINCFQIFIRSPLRLQIVEINQIEAEKCLKYIKENDLFLVSHASYLFNFGTLEKYEDKISSALNDLYYAEKIGAIGSVFHVGKHMKLTEEEGIENM